MKKKIVGYTSEHARAAAKAQQKAASGVPRIVLDAFLPERLEAEGIPLAELNLDHFITMQIACPGILQQTDPGAFDILDTMRALFICTQDQDLTAGFLGRREADPATGKTIFPDFDAAVHQLCRHLKPSMLVAVAPKLDAAIVAAMKPAVPFGVDKRTDPDSPFPAAPTPDRGLAGS